jgi:hypothetical protein
MVTWTIHASMLLKINDFIGVVPVESPMENDLKCSISSAMRKGSERQGSSAILRIQLANIGREMQRIGLRR